MEAISFVLPKDFHPNLEVAGCYIEYEDKILLLKRAPHKNYGLTWGLPGGKLDAGETPIQGVIREIFEEVGLDIKEDALREIDKMYVRYPSIDYIFYRFRTRLSMLPILNIREEEHVEGR